MKVLMALTLFSTLLISACAVQHPSTAPAVASVPTMTIKHNYRCESGQMIVASYINKDSATIEYQTKIYNLQIAVSGSGSRYIGDGFVWWIKGLEGGLFQHWPDGSTGERIELCTTE